jgi:hypothetical protein
LRGWLTSTQSQRIKVKQLRCKVWPQRLIPGVYPCISKCRPSGACSSGILAILQPYYLQSAANCGINWKVYGKERMFVAPFGSSSTAQAAWGVVLSSLRVPEMGMLAFIQRLVFC